MRVPSSAFAAPSGLQRMQSRSSSRLVLPTDMYDSPLHSLLSGNVGRQSWKAYECCSSPQFNRGGHIEFRVILLHIFRAILLPKLVDHGFHRVAFGDGLHPEFRLNTPGINPNLRIVEHVAEPLRLRTPHWEKVEFFVFQDEPNRN